MNNLKFIGLAFLILFSYTAFAQEQVQEQEKEEGEIVMTESELASLLQKIAYARRAQLKAKNEVKSKNELTELRNKYNNQQHTGSYKEREISNYEILREIDRLNARLDYMATMNSGNSRMISGEMQGQGSSTSTIVVPGSSNAPSYIPYNQGQQQYVPIQAPAQSPTSASTPAPTSNTEHELATARSIWELEKRLDSLYAAQASLQQAAYKMETEPQEKVDNQEIIDLQNQFKSLEERLASTQNPTERRYLLEELLKKFENFKQQVYFANNSDQLNAVGLVYVNEVTLILQQYPELSVMLEGWASPRGKLDYNKQLSMRRSESVEQAFLRNGIPGNRIVSSFRGVDKTSTEAGARRVDMTIILK